MEALRIWAWPTIVPTDKKDRYSHINEGAYEKTESMIDQLLQENKEGSC